MESMPTLSKKFGPLGAPWHGVYLDRTVRQEAFMDGCCDFESTAPPL